MHLAGTILTPPLLTARTEMAGHQVTLTEALEDLQVSLRLDVAGFEQIVSNLLGNAADASSAGGTVVVMEKFDAALALALAGERRDAAHVGDAGDALDHQYVPRQRQIVRLELGHLIHVVPGRLVHVLALHNAANGERRPHNHRARLGGGPHSEQIVASQGKQRWEFSRILESHLIREPPTPAGGRQTLGHGTLPRGPFRSFLAKSSTFPLAAEPPTKHRKYRKASRTKNIISKKK